MSSFKNRKDPSTDTSHLNEDIEKHSNKAFAWVAVSSILANIIGLGGTIILARLLGPDEFGLMAMLAVTIGLLAVFENFGLYYATIQKKTLSNEELNFLFWANLFIALVIASIMFIAAPFVAAFFEEPELLPLAQILALSFIFRGGANQHAALLNRKLEHGKSSIATVIAVFFATLGAIILAILGWGVWALVLRQVIEAFVRGVVLWVVSGWIPRLVKFQKDFLLSLKFGASLTIGNLMYYISRNADDILIGKYIGATGLGFYKLSYQVLLLPLTRINSPVAQVMIPTLSILQDKPERYKKNYLKAAHILVFIQLPVAVMFMIHSPVLIEIIFGSQWLPAATTLSWLASSLLIQGVANTTGWLLVSQARSKTILYWSTFTSVTNVSAFLIGLPYGIEGVAACYVITSYMRVPLLFFICGYSGPVKSRDLCKILLTHLPAVVVFMGLNYCIAAIIIDFNQFYQLITLMVVGLLFIPISLSFPVSRKVLMEGITYLKDKILKKSHVNNLTGKS